MKAPSTKHQAPEKLQIPNTKGLRRAHEDVQRRKRKVGKRMLALECSTGWTLGELLKEQEGIKLIINELNRQIDWNALEELRERTTWLEAMEDGIRVWWTDNAGNVGKFRVEEGID